MLNEILYVWSDSPALSLAIWIVIAMVLLYFGRPHAHQALRGTGRAIDHALRLAAASLRQLEQRVSARNREVLLAQGCEEAERGIEREFARVHEVVERELSQYPELHRRLAEALERIESDYQRTTSDAPLPPAWSEFSKTIASLPTSGDPHVVKVLDNIRDAVEDAHKQTLKAWQKSTGERHRILSGMQPHWRSLNSTMQSVQKTISGIQDRARAIDQQMARYEDMRNGEERAVGQLTTSSLTQFLIASLVLTIAAFGGLVNFHLIALPMSEMVGGAAYAGPLHMSDVAALVIVMVEISMGIFLLEALGITRLFPMIGRMDDSMRKRLAIAAGAILILFATIEASLAYLRDLLVLDRQALTQSLAGAEIAEAQFRWIPSVAQMMLGFVLPFALAFIAIPLEAFMHSLRTVLGLLVVGVLRVARVLLRMIGATANHVAKVLVSLYDVLVMVPVGIERLVVERRAARPGGTAAGEEAGNDTDSPAGESGHGRRSRRSKQSASSTEPTLATGEV